MSEKLLLLSPAKLGVLVGKRPAAEYLRWAAVAVGLFVVLVGASDLLSRVSRTVLGSSAAYTAFAPAAAIDLPAFSAAPFVASTATATPLLPARLSIPSIGVSAAVEAVGTKADGSMGTPSNFKNVAWYELGSRPGEPGNAVIAGHVNNALTTAGVFEHLSDLRLGDAITVADASGKELHYRVTQTTEYPADQAPTADIFARTGPSQLVLITCDGDWVQSQRSFDKRLVVIAQLAQ